MALNNSLKALNQRLEGKVAVITGGASGIGKVTAKLYLQNGAKVVIADVQDELGLALCQEVGTEDIAFVHCDVTKESDIEHAVDYAVSKYGKLDIMFNNAGITGRMNTTITGLDIDNFRKVFEVNLLSAFLGAKHAARVMIPAQRGSIIFTTSVNAMMAGEMSHAYASSKRAVVGLADNLCVELGQYGIRVNCISPFTTVTPMLFSALKQIEEKEEGTTIFGAPNLEDNAVQLEDIAQVAMYLGSDESRYLSGVYLSINDGYSKMNPTFTMMVKHLH